MMNRFRQSAFDRPTVRQAVLQCGVSNAGFFRPFSHTHCFVVVCQRMICASVARLLFGGGPSAVLFAVALFIVDPVNAVLRRRSRPHVFMERFKRLPPKTDCNSTTAIVRVYLATWVATSFKHVLPHLIFRRSSLTVSCVATLPALCALAASKIVPSNRFFCPTLASAKPHGPPPFVNRMQSNDIPVLEPLAGQVFHAGSKNNRISLSHDRTPITRLVRAASRFRPVGCLHCSIVA